MTPDPKPPRTWVLTTKPGRQTLAVVPDSIEGWQTRESVPVITLADLAELLERINENAIFAYDEDGRSAARALLALLELLRTDAPLQPEVGGVCSRHGNYVGTTCPTCYADRVANR